MSDKEKPDYSEGFDGCPWCDEIPEIKKHFRDGDYKLIHRCEKLVCVIMMDYTELINLKERWNQRKK